VPRMTESRSQMQRPHNQTIRTKAQEPRPMEIMSIKRVAGKNQYRVKYTDGKVYNCDWVNRPLLDHYKGKQRFNQLQQTQYRPNQRYLNAYRC